MLNLIQLRFISQIKELRCLLLAYDALLLEIVGTLTILEAVLTIEASTFGHDKASLLIAQIALEFAHHYISRCYQTTTNVVCFGASFGISILVMVLVFLLMLTWG